MSVASELSVLVRQVHDLLRGGVAAGVLLHRDGDELAAGRAPAAVPPFAAGIGMMPYSKPAFLALASCQVPFSAKA